MLLKLKSDKKQAIYIKLIFNIIYIFIIDI